MGGGDSNKLEETEISDGRILKNGVSLYGILNLTTLMKPKGRWWGYFGFSRNSGNLTGGMILYAYWGGKRERDNRLGRVKKHMGFYEQYGTAD